MKRFNYKKLDFNEDYKKATEKLMKEYIES